MYSICDKKCSIKNNNGPSKLKVGWSFGKVGVGMTHIFDGWGPHNITEVNPIY